MVKKRYSWHTQVTPVSIWYEVHTSHKPSTTNHYYVHSVIRETFIYWLSEFTEMGIAIFYSSL